jgi:hypothetical protein
LSQAWLTFPGNPDNHGVTFVEARDNNTHGLARSHKPPMQGAGKLRAGFTTHLPPRHEPRSVACETAPASGACPKVSMVDEGQLGEAGRPIPTVIFQQIACYCWILINYWLTKTISKSIAINLVLI